MVGNSLTSFVQSTNQPGSECFSVFLFDQSKVTNLFSPVIRTLVLLKLRSVGGVGGSKSKESLPSPIIMTPLSLSADSRPVLLFSSLHRLRRDESLAELNRRACVTPGYGALPLISSPKLTARFVSGLGAEVLLPQKVHKGGL